MAAEIMKVWIKHTITNHLRVGAALFSLGLAVRAITLNHRNLVIANSEPWLWLTTAGQLVDGASS